MPIMNNDASVILSAFAEVQSDLVGKAVVLTDGKAGTVENVWLDDLMGYEFPSSATMESGPSQPSNSSKMAVVQTDHPPCEGRGAP
jgi:hypothetical protein